MPSKARGNEKGNIRGSVETAAQPRANGDRVNEVDDGTASSSAGPAIDGRAGELPPDDGEMHQERAEEQQIRSEQGTDEGGDESLGDESEDEEEPTLKYARLGTTEVRELLRRDTCSAIAVSSDYVVLGMHSGGVMVLGRKGKGRARTAAGTTNGQSSSSKSTAANEDSMASVLDEHESMIVVRKYKPHSAAVMDIVIDEESQFIGTASMDGKVIILQLATSDAQEFNLKRPLRCMALEPGYANKSARQFISGGLAGLLTLHEKGWLGPKDVVLHSGEGAIWACTWHKNLIAWSNDRGTRIFDTHTQNRIAFIKRPEDSPRADLYPCSLIWRDDGRFTITAVVASLVIAWADIIKVVQIKDRKEEARQERARKQQEGEKEAKREHESDKDSVSSRTTLSNPLAGMGAYMPSFGGTSVSGKTEPAKAASSSASNQGIYASVAGVLQLDCMIAGMVPFSAAQSSISLASADTDGSNFLVLAHTDSEREEASHGSATGKSPSSQSPPELRIVNIESGEELSSDVLQVTDYGRWQCKDYRLVASASSSHAAARPTAKADDGSHQQPTEDASFFVTSPRDVILIKKRDVSDHIAWLCERGRYEQALRVAEKQTSVRLDGTSSLANFNVAEIGRKYLEHLLNAGEFTKVAELSGKILSTAPKPVKAWEDMVFTFAKMEQLAVIVPYIPTTSPKLGSIVYEMVLAHLLKSDPSALLQAIKTWPSDIYDTTSIIKATRATLERDRTLPDADTLMQCLIELHLLARQPGKAIRYFLTLRRPGVFDLIRENSLFTDIQDDAVLLIDFDMDMRRRSEQRNRDLMSRKVKPEGPQYAGESRHGEAIDLLVDHTHAIPVDRVVAQLRSNATYLYMYLDALFGRDQQTALEYSDDLVELYAEHEPARLMDLLRKSTQYSLEKAYNICKERDFVPEMVYLLGRMGNNKQALMLIIERLGDVERAISFAKEQNDNDLWEDLLTYSESKPVFIRGLLENVGPEIDPIRLIRRIRDGLEIPGLKGALIKILQDYNIQITLIDGCKSILHSDARSLLADLHRGQSSGFHGAADATVCHKCKQPTFASSSTHYKATQSSTISTSKTANRLPPTSATDPRALTLIFLCGHVYHISCVLTDEEIELPPRPAQFLLQPSTSSSVSMMNASSSAILMTGGMSTSSSANSRSIKDVDRDMSAKILFARQLRARAGAAGIACPDCSESSLVMQNLDST